MGRRMGKAARRFALAAVAGLALAGTALAQANAGTALQSLQDGTARFEAQLRQNGQNLRSSLEQDAGNLGGTLGHDLGALDTAFKQFNGNYLIPTFGTTSFVDYIQIQGLARRYIAIRPNAAAPGAPAILLLHPRGLSPEKMGNLVRAGRLAASDGAWVFLPEANGPEWHDDPTTSGADDVGFLTALIDKAVAQYGVNPKRVYAAGYSGGGFMAARLGCERANKIAAIGEVAATIRAGLENTCYPVRPLPAAIIDGTSDTVVPYNGAFAALLSAPQIAAFWAAHAACNPLAATSSRLPDNPTDLTTVDLTRFPVCAAATEVRLYTVNKGGHTWPGSPYSLYTAELGATSRDIDATLELWKFLSGYTLP